MELFHTCTPAFLKTYQQHHKLDGDYHKFRKPIYQLYPMINHVRLFGESYLKPLTAAVEKTCGPGVMRRYNGRREGVSR